MKISVADQKIIVESKSFKVIRQLWGLKVRQRALYGKIT